MSTKHNYQTALSDLDSKRLQCLIRNHRDWGPGSFPEYLMSLPRSLLAPLTSSPRKEDSNLALSSVMTHFPNLLCHNLLVLFAEYLFLPLPSPTVSSQYIWNHVDLRTILSFFWPHIVLILLLMYIGLKGYIVCRIV